MFCFNAHNDVPQVAQQNGVVCFNAHNDVPQVAQQNGVVGWCNGAGQTSSARAFCLFGWVGQGPSVLAVGVGGECLDIFSLVYHFFLSPSLGDGPI